MSNKLQVKQKNSLIQVKYKIKKDEFINKREYDILSQKIIRGIMKPRLEKKALFFDSPDGISLKECLNLVITKNDFYLIVAQIVELVKSVEKNMFDINNLVLDTKYVFINCLTRELHFIYKPLISYKSLSNISAFIYEVASCAKINQMEDSSSVTQLITYLQTMRSFSIVDIEEHIIKACPDVYKQIQRQEYAKSVNLNDKKISVEDIYYSNQSKQANMNNSFDNVSTVINNSEYYKNNQHISNEREYEKETSLLINEGADTSSLGSFKDNGTFLLVDDTKEKYPYLVKLNGYENIEINKPSFRIGKESSYVDYFIQNNSTISRIHADIITRDKCYFIKDNNSTNGTIVNGIRLGANAEMQIYDGDEIVLANEKFIFNIS